MHTNNMYHSPNPTTPFMRVCNGNTMIYNNMHEYVQLPSLVTYVMCILVLYYSYFVEDTHTQHTEMYKKMKEMTSEM